jgi:hypothetical protein
MIPWGTDQAFFGDVAVGGPLEGELARRCLASSACGERLRTAVRAVTDELDSADFREELGQDHARITAACRADPRSPWGDYGCRDAQAAMREWVEARPDVVRAQLGR